MSQSPKSGQLHSNYNDNFAFEIQKSLNPLSRVNCILIRDRSTGRERRVGRSQSPKSGQLHSNDISEKEAVKWGSSLNPLSRVNCILINILDIREVEEVEKSQSPKSGQLHSNTGRDWPERRMTWSQSPKSGQLHSNV